MTASEDVQRVPYGEYVYPPIEKVSFGPGSVSELPAEIERLSCKRVFLVGTSSVANSPLWEQMRERLGDALVGSFAGVRQHTPAGTVVNTSGEIQQARADIVVSLGGGSVIDATKAAVLAVARDTGQFLPHIALPTTLSAAEFSTMFGVTDEETHRKSGGNSPFVQPQFVILDVDLARYTPDWLWFASGIRALDHAVETVYAPNRQPATDATALHAIRMLFEHLPASAPAPIKHGPGDKQNEVRDQPQYLNARQQCQIAAWLSFFGVGNITLGMSHALGREIGPRYNVPHGYTSAVLLPHVMSFLLSETEEPQAAIAAATGAMTRDEAETELALEAAPRVTDLIGRLGLPQRLRDLQVPESDLVALAGGREEILHVLREAW
ncbi:MAG: iron-containing alcohol dehydrogenase [Chloroflexota bacterium]